MATNEGLVLNGLDLNPGAGPYWLRELHMPPPVKRQEWTQGGDADGSTLVRDPLFENRQITGTLEIVDSTRDGANTDVAAVVAMLEEAELNAGGIPLVWTPSNGTRSLTAYVLSGQLGEIPQTIESGYFATPPLIELPFSFDCKPFLYGAEINSVTDDFSSNTIANYSFDAGGGTLSVTGGQLVPSSTAEKRLYYNPTGYSFADGQVTLKFVTGAATTGGPVGLILRRLDGSNFLIARYDAGTLTLRKWDGGTESAAFATSGAVTLAANTAYWLRFRANGNVLTVEHWTVAPTLTGSPAVTVSYTLTGADATKFGTGVAGQAGMRLVPNGTDWRYDDFTLDPNLARGTDPIVTVAIPNALGDVSGEARLIVSDPAAQSRRYVEWGVQSRWTNLANALLLDDGVLVTAGFAGTSGSLSGAYGGTAITATLTSSAVAVCGLGNLANIGTFRVKARVRPSTSTIVARLSWKEGDGPLRANTYQTMQQSATFIELDLGLVTIPQKQLGTQRWTGQIEAYDPAGPGSTLAVDHIVLVPAEEGYGKARGVYSYVPGVVTAYDYFTNTTAGAVLNARTAPSGGTWATSGATTDFTFADGPDTGAETITRATTGDTGVGRFALLGTATPSDDELLVALRTPGTSGYTAEQGLVARYVDANNYLSGHLLFSSSPALVLNITSAGVAFVSTYTVQTRLLTNSWYALRLVVYASGRAILSLLDTGLNEIASFSITNGSLASGGLFATGKHGVRDYAGTLPTGNARYYDNFQASTPAPEQIALYSGRQAEIRHDGSIRQDSTGTYWGQMPEYRGSRFLLPPAGEANRVARVLTKADRNDVQVNEDVPLGDVLQAQVAYTPRYL